jgi:hypothetical protein
VKPHFNLRALGTLGQLALAGCLVLMPAAAGQAAPKAGASSYTVVGYDRSIAQQDFAGFD